MQEAPATVPTPSPEAENVPAGGFAQSEEIDAEDIPETDIVFECPHCSKSLSIDQRGAGLVIRCTQCGNPVTVPIPEGMEIEDFDATPEELSAQLLHTRQALAKAQKRIEELEAERDAALAERAAEHESATAVLAAARRRENRRELVAAPFRAVLARAVREAETSLATLREVAAGAAEVFAPETAESSETPRS